LHGFPEFWYGWRHQIDHLAWKGLRVWVPDQRGYNLSDKPKDLSDYRIDELVMDVVGLINSTGHDKAFIAGHDWGAMVAWWLALRHPDLIEKLVIMNVPHPRVFQRQLRSNIKQLVKSWYAGWFQLPFIPERTLRFADSRIFARFIQMTANKGSFTDEDMQQYRQAWAQPNAMKSMLNWYRAYLRYPPKAPKNWRVSVPTMIIWGKKDVALSFDLVEPSYDLLDNGELVIMEKATHWVQHDEKERVSQLLGMYFV
ncbi:MAG: alpha/beta hydrolase, partial [Phototrophicales bacterium]